MASERGDVIISRLPTGDHINAMATRAAREPAKVTKVSPR